MVHKLNITPVRCGCISVLLILIEEEDSADAANTLLYKYPLGTLRDDSVR